MWDILSKFFLICHFSLVFSLSVLCSIFFIKTRDRIVLKILTILLALFVHSFASLFFYIFTEELGLLFENINAAISLFLLVITAVSVSLIIFGTSAYMLSLIDLPERKRLFAKRIIIACSMLFMLFGLYFIVFINGNDWRLGLSRALNELFLYGSLFLLLPAVTALVYLNRKNNKQTKQLLLGIIIAFIPIAALAILDLIFFMDSAYKLVYISYTVFSILVYMFTARYYVHSYEPANDDFINSASKFYKSMDISEREKELIPFLLEGVSNKELSGILNISTNTVKTHVRNIYRKTGVTNRLQLLSKIRAHSEG